MIQVASQRRVRARSFHGADREFVDVGKQLSLCGAPPFWVGQSFGMSRCGAMYVSEVQLDDRSESAGNDVIF